MNNIKSMANASGDSRHTDAKETMRATLSEFEDGELKNHKKVLILALNEDNGSYDVAFRQAGMNMSECISLCEVIKPLFLEEMGY